MRHEVARNSQNCFQVGKRWGGVVIGGLHLGLQVPIAKERGVEGVSGASKVSGFIFIISTQWVT